MKASNPATKNYLTKDVFTYISYVPPSVNKDDTAQFKIYEMKVGDTGFYNNGFFILNKVTTIKAPTGLSKQKIDAELSADLTFINNDDSIRYKVVPRLKIDSMGFDHIDDTIYAKGVFVQFAGIADEQKIKIGVKNTNQMTDFITLKAYIFPYINLVWLGLVIMALGIIMSGIKRAKLSTFYAALALVFAGVGLFYMFLLAN